MDPTKVFELNTDGIRVPLPLHTIIFALEDHIRELHALRGTIRKYAVEKEELKEAYSLKKHGYIIGLKAKLGPDEKVPKDKLIEAGYRSQFHKERTAYMMAESIYDAAKEELKNLLGAVNALQTLKNEAEAAKSLPSPDEESDPVEW
jgi:hypothetical protein